MIFIWCHVQLEHAQSVQTSDPGVDAVEDVTNALAEGSGDSEDTHGGPSVYDAIVNIDTNNDVPLMMDANKNNNNTNNNSKRRRRNAHCDDESIANASRSAKNEGHYRNKRSADTQLKRLGTASFDWFFRSVCASYIII